MEKVAITRQIKIMAIGVGNPGSKIINRMITDRPTGVDYLVINTDSQDFAKFRERVCGADIVLVVAGMGGETGSNITPIIAKECKKEDILTVAIVTSPFRFEGKGRMQTAMIGIGKLRNAVDNLIVIPNEQIRSLHKPISFNDLISLSDDALVNALKGVCDLILSNELHPDLMDWRRVFVKKGGTNMGTGLGRGKRKVIDAIQTAISSPFLEEQPFGRAEYLLVNIIGPSDMVRDEIDYALKFINVEINDSAEVFCNVAIDDKMKNEVKVIVIATGISSDMIRRLRRFIRLGRINAD